MHDRDLLLPLMCTVGACSMRWPRDQLMPSSFWCNCRKCLSCFSNLGLTLMALLCHPDTGTQYCVSSICFMTSVFMTWATFSPSCKHWFVVKCFLCMHHKFFYTIISARLSYCMCVFLRTETGCLFALTEGEKCSGFIALQAGCLTSCTTAPAFFLLSLCQCEGCYGCSAAKNLFLLSMISWKCPFTTTNGLCLHTSKTKALHFYISNTFLVFVYKNIKV